MAKTRRKLNADFKEGAVRLVQSPAGRPHVATDLGANDVNGQMRVAAGGQVKVPIPR